MQLYLVLSGMVRVFRTLPGGETAANNLDMGNFFGEAAFIDEIVPAADGLGPPTVVPGRRAAGVKPLCKTYLLRLDRLAFKELAKGKEYEWLSGKFRRERRRVLSRNELFQTGWMIIPRDPPPSIAERLVLTQNILLIDMNRCTRCDQCVQGCACRPRRSADSFHRSNPELQLWAPLGSRSGLYALPGRPLHGSMSGWSHNAPRRQCGSNSPHSLHRLQQMCEGVSLRRHRHVRSPVKSRRPKFQKQDGFNKCDLYLTEDDDPRAVAWCPYDAAQRVDPNDFFSGLKGRARFRRPSIVSARQPEVSAG